MISPQLSLVAGIALSFWIRKNPLLQSKAKVWATKLLQLSVILLGSSLNFSSVLKEGASGVLITSISIASVFLLGWLGIKMLKLEKKLGLLITMGTAICGGSAIGALAPVLGAESTVITISIAIVFLLNSLAVFLFPPLGHYFELTQSQFGMWAALAIHDTSSVVAASSLYGQEALEIATTVKLTRALWIIPITTVFGLMWNRKSSRGTFPVFVIGFLLMSLAFTFIAPLNTFKEIFLLVAKNGFALTLFLIGLSFDLKKMKEVGHRPLLFGVVLWIIVSSFSLIAIKGGI